MGDKLYKYIPDGKFTRYRFEFPMPLIDLLAPKGTEKIELFSEEIDEISYIAREMMMNWRQMAEKKITTNCTTIDILLFKRFFIMYTIIQSYLFSKEKNLNVIAASIVPVFQEEEFYNLIDIFTKDRTKTKELIDLFTYDRNFKLDLQYTPLIKLRKRYIFPGTTLSMANSIRNAIAYSYMVGNHVVNDDGQFEPLVNRCKDIFDECSYHYRTNENLKYTYFGKDGEIDFIAYSDNDIFIFECKAPLMPTSNFEMRSSYDYIIKASKQLDMSLIAFQDETFRNTYFREWNIEYKNQIIHTCILMGNRLFSGYTRVKHPIRYIYELDMVLNNGKIKSDAGEWSYWQNDKYQPLALLNFLSSDDPLGKSLFASMNELKEEMSCGEEHIMFKTFYYNAWINTQLNDNYLRIISKNEELRESLKEIHGTL